MVPGGLQVLDLLALEPYNLSGNEHCGDSGRRESKPRVRGVGDASGACRRLPVTKEFT